MAPLSPGRASAQAPPQPAPADTVANAQANNAFNSLEDGQPVPPGQYALVTGLGWQDLAGSGDPADLSVQLQHTPSQARFLRNLELQLTLGVQTGANDLEATTTAGWQQRWIANARIMFTVASLLEINVPTSGAGGVDGTVTGILVKRIGPGSAYWNGFLQLDGGGLGLYGSMLGYQVPATRRLSLTADYVRQNPEGDPPQNILELSAAYAASGSLSVGPGILLGLDRGSDTPRLGAGVLVTISL